MICILIIENTKCIIYDTINYINEKHDLFLDNKQDILDKNCDNYRQKINTSKIKQDTKLETKLSLVSKLLIRVRISWISYLSIITG